MTDRTKFEQMLEHLINEEQDKASELFHELVVSKSREIYENILSDSFGDEDEMGDEEFGPEDEHDIGGDETDDFIDDMESDEDEGMGDEGEFGDEGLEDRVVDLEDALDDLRAEFEELMAKESGESEHDDDFGDEESDSEDFGDMDAESDSEDFGDEESDSEDFGDEEEFKKESFFREYVEKVTIPKGGDDGANTKSVVAKPNRMGGSSANITRGGEEKTGGTQGGLAKPSAEQKDFGNINKPGGNAGKTAFKTRQPGHGAEKKGTRDGATDTKSVVSGGNKGGKR